MSNFELVFGALADPIEKQLRKQGLRLVIPGNAQDLARSISLLSISGCLTTSEATKARQRLIKRIRVAPLQGTKP